jgi:hypothetical protein
VTPELVQHVLPDQVVAEQPVGLPDDEQGQSDGEQCPFHRGADPRTVQGR